MMPSTSLDFNFQEVVPSSGSAEGNIIFAEFHTGESYPMPEGSVSIDDLIINAESEPAFAEELENARKLLAEKIYKDNSITALRLRFGWSQRKLAEKLNTSQSHVSKIESGREDLRLSTIRKLASVFNVDEQEIIKALSA